MSAGKTHADKVPIDVAVVRRLVATQFPQWKGLITLAEHINTNPIKAGEARRVIDEVLADHQHAA